MNTDILAQKIIEQRKQRGWKWTDMSKRLGVDYRAVKAYEQREREIPADILLQYSKIFGVSLDYLCHGTEINDTQLLQEIKTLSPKQRKAIMSVINSYH